MHMDGMRVLHINCNYMGTKLHQIMIEHLDPYVEENKVFCPIYSGSELATKPNENVVVSNCFTLTDRAFFFQKQRKIISSLESKIDVLKYDLMHAYTLFTDGNTAYELSRKYGIPYVVAIRSTDLQFFKYRPYLKKRGLEILNNASKVFFLSDTTRSFVIEHYVPNQMREKIYQKSKVIPNGIDDFWLNNCYAEREYEEIQKRLNSKKINVVCVSQIIKRKNIPFLQRSIMSLNKQGWDIHLTVIGKVVNKREFARIIKDQNTTYVDPIPKEKLIEYYRAADLFALPSKGETFGLVYAEAMSQGLPVIYSKDEGFDGQFPEGVVGYHVNPNDPLDIVMQLKKLCNEYERISIACSRKCKNFLWDDIARTYSKIYSEVL